MTVRTDILMWLFVQNLISVIFVNLIRVFFSDQENRSSV
jgi:hypothetical protein